MTNAKDTVVSTESDAADFENRLYGVLMGHEGQPWVAALPTEIVKAMNHLMHLLEVKEIVDHNYGTHPVDDMEYRAGRLLRFSEHDAKGRTRFDRDCLIRYMEGRAS